MRLRNCPGQPGFRQLVQTREKMVMVVGVVVGLAMVDAKDVVVVVGGEAGRDTPGVKHRWCEGDHRLLKTSC